MRHGFVKCCEPWRQYFHRGIRHVANAGTDHIRHEPVRGLFPPTHRCALAARELLPKKSLPSAVSVTPRGLTRRRSTPISSSKFFTRRLNAGCATRSCATALVKFDASPTARKYRRCRSSIVAFHYVGMLPEQIAEQNGDLNAVHNSFVSTAEFPFS